MYTRTNPYYGDSKEKARGSRHSFRSHFLSKLVSIEGSFGFIGRKVDAMANIRMQVF